MADSQKFSIVFEAKDAASRKIAELQQQLANLGGPDMVKAQNEIKKLERQVNQLSGTSDKGNKVFSKLTQDIAVGAFTAQAAMQALHFAWRTAVDLISSTITAAANSQEVWDRATAALERHGLATQENLKGLAEFAAKMQKLTGVADEEYIVAIQQMIDRGASLSQSYQLVSAAADAAASRHVSLSETLAEFANAVGRESLVKLEKYGIVIKETTDFSDQLNNAILQLNANFGGAAVDASVSYSVQLNVMKQTFGDLKEKIGAEFLPILTELAKTAIAFFEEFSKAAWGESFTAQGTKTETAGNGIIDMLKSMQVNMRSWVNIFIGATGIIVNAIQIIEGAILTVLAPVVDLVVGQLTIAFDALSGGITTVSHLLQGEFTEAWESGKHTISGVITGAFDLAKTTLEDIEKQVELTGEDVDDLAFSFEKLTRGVSKLNAVATAPVVTAGTAAKNAANKARAEAELANMKAKLEKSVSGTTPFEDLITTSADSVTLISSAVLEHTSKVREFVETVGTFMKERMVAATDSIIGSIALGRGRLKDIFKSIAEDFAVFFIKKALASLVSTFIPGLGAILGGLFDTPVNDRMAAQQGADFAAWFQRGAMAQFAGGTALAATATRGNNQIIPTGQARSSGSGTVVMNINITGNILSDRYIEQSIAPKLKQLVIDGKSALTLQKELVTGNRNVRID